MQQAAEDLEDTAAIANQPYDNPVTPISLLLDAVRSVANPDAPIAEWRHVATLASRLISFDVETHLIQPGLLAPPLVCASVAYYVPDGTHGTIEAKLVGKDEAREIFLEILDDPDAVLVGANTAFDVLVMVQDFGRRGIDILPRVFAAYEQGRIYDVQIAQQLHAIAEGTLNKDPLTMRGLHGRYSLATCVAHVLGRTDAKKNDRWRLRYAELENVPVADWPDDAREYPLDDARNTLEVTLAQLGCAEKQARHKWGVGGCQVCGSKTISTWCWRAEPHANLHSVHDQVYTHWAMHLGAAWGFRVDQAAVDEVERKALEKRVAALPDFVRERLIRADGSRDTAAIARRVAEAYDAIGICPVCEGMAKAPSEKTGKPINCKACSATGFDFSRSPDVPRTDTARVSAARDVLDESGDETLMALAGFGRLNKTVETYAPYLRSAGNRPLTLKPNPLLETDRTSYSDPIQQFPRGGGLRECVVARSGYCFCSVDYKMGEIITHAQSCLWIVGRSDLADALLKGEEPHMRLGAAMLGLDYPEFCKRFYDKTHPGHKQAKDARQAAKPGNFGFPGGMGAPKMALQQRRGGPDTPCPAGPAILDAKKGTRGYRGLRFCILMNGAERCGETKLTEWKGRPCPPLCAECLECAERLRDFWFGQWSEMKPYFKFTSAVANQGQEPGLDPGQMILHVSRIVRGGCNYTSTSNGYFQALLARAAKLSLRRAQRECADRTLRVPDDACRGGRVSAYAGLDSPLLGSRVVAFYHDENFSELVRAQKHDAATRLSEIMVRTLQETCPDLAPACEAPPALMPRWLKSAEPMIHMIGGRRELVEWTPEHSDPAKCDECRAAA